ncbi:bifunctional heptose 7-phosphate kinase/heptose 1-phosphate adenyltransferase [Peredibacter starrii]|uniref:PfkB family carbohydrate kinase n=1 Tax=Peredibacter starrii TaxID=28202 RepID=A0AAX4HT40_9BACT|nr:PfkB family carbohydrate kinase [Peredibacter starrii]WPU66356.1 PfkB family carbohydrate kinase [Peredibacter starrii]
MILTSDKFEKILFNFQNLKPILVVGDLGVDKYTFGDVKRISPEAPVPVLEVTKEWNKLGLAANVSDNLMSLEVPSTLCGVIGDDSRASLVESLLEERGLKTWGLVRDPSRHTTYKERVTTATQQICRVDYETKDPLQEDIARRVSTRVQEFSVNHSGVIIEDYGKGLFSEALCQKIIQEFKEKDLLVAVDPSRSTPPLWYKGTTLLKPNRLESELMVEALGYFKEKKLETIANILVDKLKVEKLVITLGADGMAMLDTKLGGDLKIIPTVANEVFDVSGAGDTTIAAICSALLSGATLEEAGWVGNCAAGVVVRKRGTALCSKEELRDYFQNLRKVIKQ